MSWIWLDGQLVPRSKVCRRYPDIVMPQRCHPGFLPRRGLFESMRCYQGCVFALRRHLCRLRQGCCVLGIPVPSLRLLERAVKAAIGRNGLEDAALRLFVWQEKGDIRICVAQRSLPEVKDYYSLAVVRWPRMPVSVLSSVKVLDRRFYRLIAEAARKKGCDEGVFLNRDGDIVEGSRTNLFCVRKGVVFTPPLSSGCLSGIARSIVLALLMRAGIRVRERVMGPAMLREADEIFVTNALIGVMPALCLGRRRIPQGVSIGPMTRLAQELYEKLVEKECRLR